jgi:hypothetical protein
VIITDKAVGDAIPLAVLFDEAAPTCPTQSRLIWTCRQHPDTILKQNWVKHL